MDEPRWRKVQVGEQILTGDKVLGIHCDEYDPAIAVTTVIVTDNNCMLTAGNYVNYWRLDTKPIIRLETNDRRLDPEL